METQPGCGVTDGPKRRSATRWSVHYAVTQSHSLDCTGVESAFHQTSLAVIGTSEMMIHMGEYTKEGLFEDNHNAKERSHYLSHAMPCHVI